MSTQVSFLFLAALVALTFAVVWAVRQGSPRVDGRGSILGSLGLIFSKPAFLVPATMTATIVGIIVAATYIAGDNFWLRTDDGPTMATLLGISVVISAGIAGLIGLLEAHQAGKQPDSNAFLWGIGDHFFTIFLAKVLLAGWFAQFRFHPPMHWRPEAMIIMVPAIMLAPVIGTATRYPRRPFQAILASATTAIAHPIATLRVFAAHALLLVAAVEIFDSTHAAYHMWSNDQAYWLAIVHGSHLSFNLFPFLAAAATPETLLISVPLILLSTVCLTGYWTIANGTTRREPAVETITEAA